MTPARPIAFAAVLALGFALQGPGSMRAAGPAPDPLEPAAPADPAARTDPAAPAAASGGVADPITRIMEDNEALLAGRAFSYNPAGRRDPFRSLIDPLNSPQRGPRPRGIAGMLISEVDLVGIVQKGRGHIAFFNGSDNKGYFLEVGDTLYDGKIIKIDRRTGTVLFRQDVNDPRSIKPYRDVTKRLALAEEERL